MSVLARRVMGVIVLVAVVALSLAVLLLPHYRIINPSMTGKADVGSEVYLAKRDHYQAGSIVTVKSGRDVFTHQLLGYNPDGTLITKGAANADIDGIHRDPDTDKVTPLTADNIVGEVVLIVPQGRLVTSIVFIVLILLAGWLILSTLDEESRSRPQPRTVPA